MNPAPATSDASDGPCPCRLCRSGADRLGWDESDHKLVSDVTSHGWHVVGVTGDPSPSWCYSVGLTHTFGVSEAVMAGLSVGGMHRCINNLGDAIRIEGPPSDGQVRDDIFEGAPATVRVVDPSWNSELFGYASWFYGEYPSFVQLVWPDREDRFPWDPGFSSEFHGRQPELWSPIPDSWPRADELPVPAHAAWPGSHGISCVTQQSVVDGMQPVLLVAHDDDGWQAVTGEALDLEQAVVVHLHHLLDQDPTLLEVHDLQAGWIAERDAPGGPWRRSPAESVPTWL